MVCTGEQEESRIQYGAAVKKRMDKHHERYMRLASKVIGKRAKLKKKYAMPTCPLSLNAMSFYSHTAYLVRCQCALSLAHLFTVHHP